MASGKVDIPEILRKYLEGSTRDYDVMTSQLGSMDCQSPFLYTCLKGMRKCITLLGKEFETLVGTLLRVEWLKREDKVIKEYQSMITNLVSAHPSYLKACLRMIIKFFTPKIEGRPDQALVVDEQTRKQHEDRCVHLHTLLQSLLQIVPMAPRVLLPLLSDLFPYMTKDAYIQQCYVHNLLLITQYLPGHRVHILELVVDRMTQLDVRSPRHAIQEAEPDSDEDDVIFQMDEDEANSDKPASSTSPHPSCLKGGGPMSHKEADRLDVMMDLVLTYIHSVCYREGELDWESSKKLYKELLLIFDKVLLPTHASCHVQFLMFYICSFKEPLCEGFLDYLWKKVIDPNTQAVFRQAAVAYVASLLARANYIPVSTVKATLDVMVPWIHRYISQASSAPPDAKHHGPFYSVCQAVFYALAFRHKQLLQMRKGQKYCQSLNLQTIVTSRLNPLRLCLPLVARTFASVARIHQLAYCDTIMEKNRRSMLPTTSDGTTLSYLNPLNSFFPFDPYLLKRSGRYIRPLYQEYEGAVVQEDEKMEDDEDDHFTQDMASSSGGITGSWNIRTPTSPNPSDFLMYSVSPGFKTVMSET